MHDPRFFIQSASSIEIQGNVHLTRDELLSIFGEDVERNIFYVSLAQRRAQLEQLPWVEHATVMRLLPNRLRVSIVERTPVAFVRQGSQIGLVDASGVLLDMPPHGQGDAHYSFPVVTGILASDPASTRAARMKIFEQFTSDLDSSGEKISQKLSEVDLSNPEDVKALIPDHGKDVLVHFGETDFLDRYRKFEEHLPEWRTQYPTLSSVDMRYERQVVLEMQPGTAAAAAAAGRRRRLGRCVELRLLRRKLRRIRRRSLRQGHCRGDEEAAAKCEACGEGRSRGEQTGDGSERRSRLRCQWKHRGGQGASRIRVICEGSPASGTSIRTAKFPVIILHRWSIHEPETGKS